MCSEITKHFSYKRHGMFINSPVMNTELSNISLNTLSEATVPMLYPTLKGRGTRPPVPHRSTPVHMIRPCGRLTKYRLYKH